MREMFELLFLRFSIAKNPLCTSLKNERSAQYGQSKVRSAKRTKTR